LAESLKLLVIQWITQLVSFMSDVIVFPRIHYQFTLETAKTSKTSLIVFSSIARATPKQEFLNIQLIRNKTPGKSTNRKLTKLLGFGQKLSIFGYAR
jgi:hypothetical protein